MQLNSVKLSNVKINPPPLKDETIRKRLLICNFCTSGGTSGHVICRVHPEVYYTNQNHCHASPAGSTRFCLCYIVFRPFQITWRAYLHTNDYTDPVKMNQNDTLWTTNSSWPPCRTTQVLKLWKLSASLKRFNVADWCITASLLNSYTLQNWI